MCSSGLWVRHRTKPNPPQRTRSTHLDRGARPGRVAEPALARAFQAEPRPRPALPKRTEVAPRKGASHSGQWAVVQLASAALRLVADSLPLRRSAVGAAARAAVVENRWAKLLGTEERHGVHEASSALAGGHATPRADLRVPGEGASSAPENGALGFPLLAVGESAGLHEKAGHSFFGFSLA